MSTPALMLVTSRVVDPQKTSDELYNRWYNEEHLPDLVASGWTKLGLRYKNVKEDADKLNVAFYTLDDISVVESPLTAKVMEETKKSKIMGCDDIWEELHISLSPYGKIQSYEAPESGSDGGDQRRRTICCIRMEPAEGKDGELDTWLKTQHLDSLKTHRGFRRCTRYKNLEGETPSSLALYEYDCAPKDFPAAELLQLWAAKSVRATLDESKAYQMDVFALIHSVGDQRIQL